MLEKKLKIYSFEEALKKSVDYFKGDELAATAWLNKYALKDSLGNIYEVSPDEMHQRLTGEIARIEQKYPNPISGEEIYFLLKDFRYIVPQGSPMTGIGNDHQIVSISNCFVIGNTADSYGGIMKTDEEQVQLMKRRGGVGHDLSHLRPGKIPVNNSALTSTGIVSFMERYSNSTREVAQDGRRGALMLTISIRHPDAEKFIDAKTDKKKVTGANVSVKVDDEFMKAVLENRLYTQRYPIDSEKPKIKKEIKAKDLWKKIVHNAWKSAEPGILFWDTIIRESIPDCYADLGYKTISTNPCGEIPLCTYDSCRLLALNLYNFVENPFTKNAKFNFDLFRKYSGYAQRIMDDIIDLEIEKIEKILKKINYDPEKEKIKSVEKNLWEKILHKTKEGRRTGVGVTAEGDMLASLGLKYGSDEAIKFSSEVHKTLALEAYRSSVNMAKERGAFEIYDSSKEKNNPFIQRLKKEDETLYNEMSRHGRRNIALLTIAPTGTTSLMTQTTSGIEPVFNVVYIRRKKVNPNDKETKVSFIDEIGDSWEEYNVFHHKFKTWLEVNGYDIKKIKNCNKDELEKIVRLSPYHKATSNDVDWVSKVKMQGAIQKWVDHSISATVNVPENTPKKMIEKIYYEAWKAGCKGVTVYRDGSRSGVLISEGGKENSEKKFPPKRPKSLDAEVLKFNNGEEKWIAFVGLIDGKPYEIFTGKSADEVLAVPNSITRGKIVKEKINGKSYYDFVFKDRNGFESKIGGISHQFKKEYWNYARFISSLLRKEVQLNEVVEIVSKLEEVEGINSWKSGTIRAIKKYIPDGTKTNETCGDCKTPFYYQEGCKTCSCGSKCE